jgi:hypothetical protein
MVPRTYRFQLAGESCAPTSATFELVSQVTGGRTRLVVSPSAPPTVGPNDDMGMSFGAVPSLSAGESSPHAWTLPPAPAPVTVTLGPGAVEVPVSRTFLAHETVVIAPDTQVLFGKGASLYVYGKLLAEGTASEPISFEPARPEWAFGGIAIQGEATEGTRLSHVVVRHGTTPKGGAVKFSATLNVHHTQDVGLHHVSVFDATADDAVHFNTVKNLVVDDLLVSNASVDGIDLEMTEGTLRRIRVAHAGDDCLDIMSSKLALVDTVLLACLHNGVSAGEQTEVAAHALVVADAETGVLAKNASTVRIERSIVYRVKRALRTRKQELYYDGQTSIRADELTVANCDEIVVQGKGTKIDSGRLRLALPDDHALVHLRSNVLGLHNWGELDAFVSAPEVRWRGAWLE